MNEMLTGEEFVGADGVRFARRVGRSQEADVAAGLILRARDVSLRYADPGGGSSHKAA